MNFSFSEDFTFFIFPGLIWGLDMKMIARIISYFLCSVFLAGGMSGAASAKTKTPATSNGSPGTPSHQGDAQKIRGKKRSRAPKKISDMKSNQNAPFNHHGAFAVMTLKQLGRLDHFSRIRYLQLMRESMAAIEKVQNRLGYQVAHHASPSKDFFALIFGDNVSAEGTSKPHARNYEPKDSIDHCIYGGHYQEYASRQHVDGCIRPSCTQAVQDRWQSSYSKDHSFSTTFVLCSFSTFGIEKCVYPGADSTIKCDSEAKRLAKQNKKKVDEFLKKKITEEWRAQSATQRLQLINELREYAYDPRVMSHLVKLAADYKAETGKDFNSVPGLEDFERFDLQSEGMSELFRDFKDHCQRPLSSRAIQSVKGEKGKRGVLRNKYLSEVTNNQQIPLVGSVLQRPECETLLGKYNAKTGNFEGGRYAQFVNSYQDIMEHGYPQRVADAPETPTESEEGLETLPEETAPAPEPPIPPETLAQTATTGCRPAHELLIDRGMQCAKCVAEKSLTDGEPSNYSQTGVSQKWLSLLTTMIYQCHEPNGSGTPSPKDMADLSLKYVQTFGHCQVDDYDWGRMTPSQVQSVRDWQMGRELDQAKTPGFFAHFDGKKKNPFKDIYGLNIEDAKDLFCQKTSGAKDPPGTRSYSSSGSSQRDWAQRRLHMLEVYEQKFRSGAGNWFESSGGAGDGLRKCLNRINQRLKDGTLFSSTQGASRCQSFASPNDPRTMRRAIDQALTEQPVIAVDSNGHCYVSHTTHQKADQSTMMIFAEPKNNQMPRPVYEGSSDGKGTWQYSPDYSIAAVSVAGGDNPDNSFCPDDRGRQGYVLPPQAPRPDTSPSSPPPPPNSPPTRPSPEPIKDNQNSPGWWNNKSQGSY